MDYPETRLLTTRPLKVVEVSLLSVDSIDLIILNVEKEVDRTRKVYIWICFSVSLPQTFNNEELDQRIVSVRRNTRRQVGLDFVLTTGACPDIIGCTNEDRKTEKVVKDSYQTRF